MPNDRIKAMDGTGLHEMHQNVAEELISNGYSVMGARLMHLSSMLYRVTIGTGFDEGYIFYWKEWFNNHKLKMLPATLDPQILTLKVIGVKERSRSCDSDKVEGLKKEIQTQAKEHNRQMDEMRQKLSRIGRPQGGDTQGEEKKCWKCGSTEHKSFACPLSKEDAMALKKKTYATTTKGSGDTNQDTANDNKESDA